MRRQGLVPRLLLSSATLLLICAPAAVLGTTGAAASPPASNGNPSHTDNNRGDVWLDNVAANCTGSAASQDAEACESPSDGGPGHEHDPHLACRNIDLWGDNLADSSGQFTIDGWSPSGSGTGDFGKNGYNQDQAWPNSRANAGVINGSPAAALWHYSSADNDSTGTSTQGNDVIAVIDVQQLIARAIANGDAPVNKQGFHFKLQFSQDPQKHKTFWVDCPVAAQPSPSPSASGSPSPGGSPSPTGDTSPTPSPGSSSSPTSSIESGGGGTSNGGGDGSVLAASTSGQVLGAGSTSPNTGRNGFIAMMLYAVGVLFLGLAVLTGTMAKRDKQQG